MLKANDRTKVLRKHLLASALIDRQGLVVEKSVSPSHAKRIEKLAVILPRYN